MTTATIENYQITFASAMRGTDAKSQQEESFNNYWAGIYQYIQGSAVEIVIKLLRSLPSSVAKPAISPKNLEAIKFLDQWMAEPDDLGEEFWNEFCEDLEKNRFTI